MAYCSESDLKARFGDQEIDDLLDRDNDSSADTNALSSAQADCDAQIDGYLAAKYSTPLSPVPDIIVGIACNVVRYILWGNKAPEEVRKRYEDARAQLRDIARGVITLPSTSTQVETAGGIEYDEDAYDNRVFTMSTLEDF
jgi:phage gp36-like protein